MSSKNNVQAKGKKSSSEVTVAVATAALVTSPAVAVEATATAVDVAPQVAVQTGGKKKIVAKKAEVVEKKPEAEVVEVAQVGGKKKAAPKKTEVVVMKSEEVVAQVGGKKKTAEKKTSAVKETAGKKASAGKKVEHSGSEVVSKKKAKKEVVPESTEATEVLDANGKQVRSFKVMLPGTENYEGRFTGLTPYQAANKALSKYYRENKQPKKEIVFSIRESTRGSKRSTYTYNGQREKLTVPVEYSIKDGRTIVKNFKNRLTKIKKAELETSTVEA